jgi:glucosamine-6-phosphate deaminase
MEVIIQSSSEEAVFIAARHISRVIRSKPNAVLGLATGSTPLALYAELIRMHREQGLNFSEVTTFNLDEYVGLPPNHAASYRTFMWDNFFRYVNVAPERIHIPDGTAVHLPNVCRRYEEAIRLAGGIDVQVLGIGRDGHIGFNEPTSSLVSRTRLKTLTEETRRDNARFFDSLAAVPEHVLTMGIGTIMEARQVLVLAFGESKAQAVAGAIEGSISAVNPASILQMHPDAHYFLDEAAASGLKLRAYFRRVYAKKPDWQLI